MSLSLEFTWTAVVVALSIFALRVVDMSLDTIRLLYVVRGKRMLSWILGFFQSAVFVVAISSALSNMNNILSLLGYAGGFATGNVIGMIIEERLAVGHIHLTIMSSLRGASIAEQLRTAGYAVTEISGRGRSGTVNVLHVDVKRKAIDHAETIILEADPDAFVTAEDVRPLRRGFWRA
jgi:uncharacterized protein YebE (UPF0316 family)